MKNNNKIHDKLFSRKKENNEHSEIQTKIL